MPASLVRKGAHFDCKGTLTGAATDRLGRLRITDSGVLFLDEIGKPGFDEQAMILRAIEDKRMLPVGVDK